jgi:putative transposase
MKSSATARVRCWLRHCKPMPVAAYIESCGHEVDEDGHRLLVRNGYHAEREVITAAGAVKVRQLRQRQARR